MALVSPEQIVEKAKNAYPRFLKQWVCGKGKDFFPFRVRLNLAVNSEDPKQTIAASEKLQSNSKSIRGWGYSIHRKKVRMRDFGTNAVPQAITIDTLDDFLRLSGKAKHYSDTVKVVQRVREEFSHLEDWLVSHVRTLHKYAQSIEGLIAVAHYFVKNPFPDCYMRQLPVPVHTKFIKQHQSVLREWLEELLPASEINVHESGFERRFGQRDGEVHRAIRLLDPELQTEFGLPFEELSLPLRSLKSLSINHTTVFIVENNLNLLTLPTFERGLAIRGEGYAVSRLESVSWLNSNRILYWGDIDVDGFLILSRLRNMFPHVQSIMMNQDTLLSHEEGIVEGNGSISAMPTNLSTSEAATFDYCMKNNARLEQEKILQLYVDQAISKIADASVC